MRFLTALAVLLVAGTALPALAQDERPDPRIGQIAQNYIRGATPANGFDRLQYERSDPLTEQSAQQYGQDGRPREFDRDRRRDRGLRITSAFYGVEGRACEATRQAVRLCDGKSSCTIPATNRLCGDPVPNVVKVLTVYYECQGRSRSMTRREGTYLGLRCDEQRR